MAKAEARRQRVARLRSFRREECGERSGHGVGSSREGLESSKRGDKGHRHHRRQPQVRSDRTPPSAHRSASMHRATTPRIMEIGSRHASEYTGGCLAKSQRGRSAMATNASQSRPVRRSEEHTSELQSLMRTSYTVFFLKKQIL